MTDRENHEILLADEPNPHILVWGSSGQGKTYCCLREVENRFEMGQKVLIIDYSGSYTETELIRGDFKYMKDTQILNPCKDKFYWLSSIDRQFFSVDLTNALLQILEVESYFQRKWLRQAVEKHMKTYNQWGIPEFMGILEEIYMENIAEGTKDDLDNIKRLLSRLFPYENIRNFYVKCLKEKQNTRKRIRIIQLTDFPELERQFMTKLLMTIMWKEIMRGEKNTMYYFWMNFNIFHCKRTLFFPVCFEKEESLDSHCF